MLEENQQIILGETGSSSISKVETIQELWSGYGSILRVHLSGGECKSVIVKNIVQPNLSNHPRGWNTESSNSRKIKSYQVETSWYKNYGNRCNEDTRIPNFIHFWENKGEHFILLEDLNDAGFPLRKSHLTLDELDACLKWLANFHATFLYVEPSGLWEVGTYWHLSTRQDEFEKMEKSDLKMAASRLDYKLNNCQHRTIVHGDAKVANFCFGENSDQVAAVDFQYVGSGCGMKDVAYFLGSVLTVDDLDLLSEELLSKYFIFLHKAIQKSKVEVDFFRLEQEWRMLYPLAWADFTRFLMGWMPTHQKLNRYSDKMVKMALRML